jgi:5-methylcytosine-specific restriction endonuclease McrA
MSLKGKKQTEEHIKKRRLALKGRKSPNFWLGKKRSIEDIEKFRKSHIGQIPWNKGKKIPQMSGDKHPMWKGGISKTKEYKSYYRRKNKMMRKQVPGSHTFYEWEILKARYNWTCLCCKKSEPEITLTVDHIIPATKGGSNNIENIQPLCQSCNSKKSVKIISYL